MGRPWEKIAKVQTSEEVKAAIAEAAVMLGKGDIQVRLNVTPRELPETHGDAWLAW